MATMMKAQSTSLYQLNSNHQVLILENSKSRREWEFSYFSVNPVCHEMMEGSLFLPR